MSIQNVRNVFPTIALIYFSFQAPRRARGFFDDVFNVSWIEINGRGMAERRNWKRQTNGQWESKCAEKKPNFPFDLLSGVADSSEKLLIVRFWQTPRSKHKNFAFHPDCKQLSKAHWTFTRASLSSILWSTASCCCSLPLTQITTLLSHVSCFSFCPIRIEFLLCSSGGEEKVGRRVVVASSSFALFQSHCQADTMTYLNSLRSATPSISANIIRVSPSVMFPFVIRTHPYSNLYCRVYSRVAAGRDAPKTILNARRVRRKVYEMKASAERNRQCRRDLWRRLSAITHRAAADGMVKQAQIAG